MRGKRMCGLLAAVLWLGLALPVQAAENRGSISVTMDYGDQQIHDGSVTLYQVATVTEGGYLLTQAFGGGLVRQEESRSKALAGWLAETAEGLCLPRILDADSNAHFMGLGEGLYLLVQSESTKGFQDMDPMLIPMPCYGQWEVLAAPLVGQLLTEAPSTGQHPAPIISAMTLVLSGVGLILCADKFRRK